MNPVEAGDIEEVIAILQRIEALLTVQVYGPSKGETMAKGKAKPKPVKDETRVGAVRG